MMQRIKNYLCVKFLESFSELFFIHFLRRFHTQFRRLQRPLRIKKLLKLPRVLAVFEVFSVRFLDFCGELFSS